MANNILTIIMKDSDMLMELLNEHKDKIEITGRMYKGKVRVAVDFAPEILAEVLRDETA